MRTTIQWNNQRMQISNDIGTQVYGATTSEESGYTPIELLTSSLGLCIFITISRMFERDGIEVDPSEFSVSVDAEKAEQGPSRVEQFYVEVKMPKHLDADYRKKLIRSAEKACTIGNTLQHGAKINITNKGLI